MSKLKMLDEIRAEVINLLPECDDPAAFEKALEAVSNYVFSAQGNAWAAGFDQGYRDPFYYSEDDEE